MAKSISVLLVEDNLAIAKQVVNFLEGHGWQVDFAATGKQGVQQALNGQFDVMILDLNLPDIDGLEVCKQVKSQTLRVLPVLMLTARDAFTDKAKGFGQGADDYLTKPFDLRELALRCEALARRPQLHTDTSVSEGGLSMDTRAMTVSWQDTPLAVTGIGFKILHKLLSDYPYPVSRSDLISHIWADEPPESNALKSHMYTLRKTLEKASGQPLLHTISNVGYQLKGLDNDV
ncbi:response regulator transcription factor [Alteromonas lipolytica]|uniref:DNA-binding response regulator n=1 Tax=Alteromonas lipolytica TaxID=1856405 RepID=A0A1E8FHM9_9ALTE|nr:response regulator transcription factor [Alteromonas lipolytica]OFI35457.1 DNA-binding response regulator [Alteromonas lipolytica]GGF76433.1 DNA-binding response regulator [Alteromonas lipolytica]